MNKYFCTTSVYIVSANGEGREVAETCSRIAFRMYSVAHPLIWHILLYFSFLPELQWPAWAVGSYSMGPQARGIPQHCRLHFSHDLVTIIFASKTSLINLPVAQYVLESWVARCRGSASLATRWTPLRGWSQLGLQWGDYTGWSNWILHRKF